ncbi:ATP-binding protein [Fredinandcohnia humi]
MKKRQSKKTKRGIFVTLLREYIYFSLIVGVITFISLLFHNYLVKENVKQHLSDLTSKVVFNEVDYRDVEIENIELIGGWAEVLNEQKEVIYTLGNKKDKIRSYTELELLQHVDPLDNTSEYYYSITPFTKSNEQYFFLVKIPNDRFDFIPQINNASGKILKIALLTLLASCALFFVLFVVNVFFYAKRNAASIGKPLQLITSGLHKMRNGDLKTRLDFEADYEFEQIKNAFNYMAEERERVEKEKKEIEESKKRMLVDLSHDLKTPITTIQGYSKALYEDIIEDKAQFKKYLKYIHDKSIRVSTLIDELFVLSKLDDPSLPLQKEKLDIAEFSREVILEHLDLVEDKKFNLYVDIPEKEILYVFDKKLLYRAISNILTNAVKYNPEETNLYIRLKHYEKKIVIEIGDNGIGIPEELANVIFDPFIRGDKSRSGDGGTGLGLAITKKIIERHNGRLTLDINPERGKTNFIIHLPLVW